MDIQQVLLYPLSFAFLAAGVIHFLKPRIFYRIMPPFIKRWEKWVNLIVGAAEIAGGIGLLIPATRVAAAYGLALLLIAVFPANVFMARNEKAGFGLPAWLLWLRLPLQAVLIAWALWYT